MHQVEILHVLLLLGQLVVLMLLLLHLLLLVVVEVHLLLLKLVLQQGWRVGGQWLMVWLRIEGAGEGSARIVGLAGEHRMVGGWVKHMRGQWRRMRGGVADRGGRGKGGRGRWRRGVWAFVGGLEVSLDLGIHALGEPRESFLNERLEL
jgi:hypothetical protein